MTSLFRSEVRKLLTIRSTYFIVAIALLLIGALMVYAGYKAVGDNPLWLSGVIGDTSTALGMFVALVAVLLMSHEYRHNTIMYSLTISNSRSKFLLAKVLAVVAFTAAFSVIAVVFAALCYMIGTSFSSTAGLVAPDFLWSTIWQAAFYVLAYALTGLVLAVLLRHVVGAIASLFILPTIEQLFELILKENVKYLPFGSLEQVHSGSLLSHGAAALVFAGYLLTAWVVAWYLFLHRDAN